MPLWKWIDIPPVWLALALGLAWWIGEVSALSLGGPWADFLGGLMVGGGVILMGLALVEMRRRRTTPIPHLEADHLVTSGIFRRTRNPIYLGDVLVLAGLILYWDAPLALPLVPVFVWWIERRFILPEEDRLRRKFRKDFAAYCERTRRWV
ncbi:methyltransferase family protein [Histidinibacterium lentulum]|uniref:Isoprenylcysteine carboxylmethyltransferase family protein n=1 Tax=Histidinibacterium lentulum TaxID=2480588 RepID=A0A3N2QYG6_9RHOB|nr:isoprenylcysteine carboxylmethyltransferase family protein [Histidinibacterium lentulum]ROU00252.1 isoprenylcysteine carboxylmethyltransferase family protein [Histidinibacterium lentulum]